MPVETGRAHTCVILAPTPTRESDEHRSVATIRFESFAICFPRYTLGVVLTGAGPDGSIGLRHIKECGGLTIAQDPREAEFDSMPRSAIASGSVDRVRPLEGMGEAIRRFCETRPQLPLHGEIGAYVEEELQEVLGVLSDRTQQNFEVFRRSTLLKRLRRRMQLHQITTLAADVAALRAVLRETVVAPERRAGRG